MLNRFKAIFSDLDGTLVGKDFKISPCLKKAIYIWCKSGGHFSIITGRGLTPPLINIFEELNLSDPQVINGGAEIIDPKERKIIFGNYIEAGIAHKIIKLLIKLNMNFVVVQKNKLYSYKKINKKNIHYEKFSNLDNYFNIAKIRILIKKRDFNKKIKEFKSECLLKGYHISIIQNKTPISNNYDITANNVNKYFAALKILKLIDVDRKETVGIGDQENDYFLLKACGFKIVFENSPQKLKKIANVILPFKKNSVANLIRKLTIKKFIT